MSASQRQFIASQYAEECAFLWSTRDAIVHAPDYRLADLTELDDRIDAQLDGLRVLGERGRNAANAELHWGQPGELFTASVLAVEGQQIEALESILESSQDSQSVRGVVSAFGWVDRRYCQPLITSLIQSNDTALIHLGLAACSVHRQLPTLPLATFMRHENTTVRARALRLVGELNHSDLLNQLKDSRHDNDPQCMFWANWSIALLGDKACTEYFRESLTVDPSFKDAAVNIALRTLNHADAISLIRSIGQSHNDQRLMVTSTGHFGDPATIAWLLEKMREVSFARLSGEAFSTMTGLDLADGFEATPPEQYTLSDSDIEDLETSASEAPHTALDDGLPWPDVEKLTAWWAENKAGFKQKHRYFLGDLLSAKTCRECLKTGYQRQRAAASLELAIKSRNTGLFEIRAPGLKQRQILLA